jgi:hypothetical protein
MCLSTLPILTNYTMSLGNVPIRAMLRAGRSIKLNIGGLKDWQFERKVAGGSAANGGAS